METKRFYRPPPLTTQPYALTLRKGRPAGIEPALRDPQPRVLPLNDGCPRVVGIEPTSPVLETDILPLNYTPQKSHRAELNRLPMVLQTTALPMSYED